MIHADTIESHLHYLEDADVGRSQQSYALVRIIFSTIPILGFLGTVVGITMAIAELDLSAAGMDKSLPAVIAGLSVAFDTTAQSLALATIMLFVKFCVEKVENRLLAAVDEAFTIRVQAPRPAHEFKWSQRHFHGKCIL